MRIDLSINLPWLHIPIFIAKAFISFLAFSTFDQSTGFYTPLTANLILLVFCTVLTEMSYLWTIKQQFIDHLIIVVCKCLINNSLLGFQLLIRQLTRHQSIFIAGQSLTQHQLTLNKNIVTFCSSLVSYFLFQSIVLTTSKVESFQVYSHLYLIVQVHLTHPHRDYLCAQRFHPPRFHHAKKPHFRVFHAKRPCPLSCLTSCRP